MIFCLKNVLFSCFHGAVCINLPPFRTGPGASVGQSGSRPLSGIDLCVSMPIQIEFKKMIKPEIRSRSDPRSIHMDPYHRHHFSQSNGGKGWVSSRG